MYHSYAPLYRVHKGGTYEWYKLHLLDASLIGLSLRDNHLKSGAFSMCYRINARGWTPLCLKRQQRSRKPPRYARPSPFRSRNSRHFAVRASHASMDSFSAYPKGLGLAYSTVYGGKPPKQVRPLGRSHCAGACALFRLPRLSGFCGAKSALRCFG